MSQKQKKKQIKPTSPRRTKTYPSWNTDELMKKLFISLVEDFRIEMGIDYKKELVDILRTKSPDTISRFRNMKFPDRLQAPPIIFKMEAQLENLFKRYRFETDLYTDEELSRITFDKFMDCQIHLAAKQWEELPLRTFTVLQSARKIIKQILYGFDPEHAEEAFCFSTRATKGNTARDAYLDHKLADPITGSPEHIKWFKCHLRREGYLSSVLAECSPTGEPCFEVCTSLDLIEVPKSFKSWRLISPNTLIGSYYTYGLGSVLVRALKEAGINIATAQFKHRKLAQKASRTRELVTADLTSASESFLWTLIRRLMPYKWLRALDLGRLRSYIYKGRRYHYCSFMAMGIGFTFPLQTLLFYAISKAVCDLLKVKGTVSVYGDDLIYPRPAHRVISTVLQDLGMTLNKDKTFVETNFRESCGGDYYHGVDVRPYSYEGTSARLGRKRYEAFLYQIVNGLQERWPLESIPITTGMLREEFAKIATLICRVPPSFPDDSGWRCEYIDDLPEEECHIILKRFRNGSREFCVPHLTKVALNRYVSFQLPYLYDYFRTIASGDIVPGTTRLFQNDFNLWLKWCRHDAMKHEFSSKRESLIWLRHPKQPKRYRLSTGQRTPKLIAATACKLTSPRTFKQTSSISDWT